MGILTSLKQARDGDGTRPLPTALPNNAINLESWTDMPRENDLEGAQDQGGRHGGQKGMPEPEQKPPHGPDEKGQEQPRDKGRAPAGR